MVAKLRFKEAQPEPKLIKLDLGAGKGTTTPEGYTPIDKQAFKGITVADLTKRWPWKSSSVDEVNCSMMLHYLTPSERVHFFNELHRVLKPGAKAQIVTPMWSSHRAYIDLQTHWPPVSEGFYHSLTKLWREAQNCVDSSGLTCDFDAAAGYSLHPAIVTRNQEYQHNAICWWKEAGQDLIATLTKRE
jgi:predicted SAM-dependent methyltransferase